ncbi:MAG: hypothetical protein MUD08_02390, partial [Cytophagales bacterium]|nr:hypothetical protein [Cytophagales bacterium]
MEETDVRLVIKKFLRRWPFFLASLVLAQTGAYLYIQSAEKVYLIQASLQLKDQNLSEKGDGNKKFINGLELLESDAVLEDEIGILSAFSTIRQTVEKIGDFTKVYRSNSAFTGLDRFFSTETHKEGVSVVMDKDRPQLIDTPVHLSFVDSDTFLVEVNSTDACLYDFRSHRTVEGKHTVTIHQKGVVGKPFMSRFLSFTLWPADKNGDYWNSRYYFVNHSLKRTVESYQRRLNVAPIADESNIVNLTLKGVIPEKECVFLNTLSAVYVENDMRRKNQLGLRTIDFIDQQLGRVADTLNQVEGKLERFRASSRVIDIGASAQTLTDLLNRLEEKQTERKTQNQYYAYIEAYLSRNASLNEIVAPSMAGIADPSLTKLLNDLNDLNKERIAIAYNSSGDNNPILRILDMKIENTKKTLVEDVRNLIRSGTISIAENQRRIDQVKLKIERLPENERSLNNIQRGFRLNSEVYSYLLEKRAEASIAMASSAPDKSVVDTARQVGDKPVSPNPSLVYLVAMMLGLAAPAGLIGFRSYLDKRVEDESELEQKTHIPIIASVVYDTQIMIRRPP